MMVLPVIGLTGPFLIFSAIGVIALVHDIALPSGESWPWVVLIAAAGLLAHYCLTNALKLAPATVVIPIDFTRLPIIAIVGMLLYKEPLDPMVLLGATIIFGANYYNIWRETRL